jgi:CHAD domain-containing protein
VPEAPPRLQPAEITFPKLGPRSTVAETVTVALAASVLRLMLNEAGVRQGGDAEAVHQARVAVRRLRSDLRTFASTLRRGSTNALAVELGWLGGLLGGARDGDVLVGRMTRLVDAVPGSADGRRDLLERLEERRRMAREAMLEGIQSTRYAALQNRLGELARQPPLAGSGPARAGGREALPGLVAGPWRRLERAVGRLGENPSDEDLHSVRIAAKRVRYAAEAVAPVVGRRASKLAEAAATLQQVLGDYHDAVAAGDWLAEVATGLAPGSAFHAGTLAERERLAGERALSGWPAAWKSAARKSIHSWTG